MRRTLAISAFLATGCAGHLVPDYPARFSADRGAPLARSSTFAIESSLGILVDAALDSQAIQIVRQGLEARGLKSAPAADADVIVSINYSTGPAQSVTELASTPVYRKSTTAPRVERHQVGTDKEGRPIYTTVTVAGQTTEEYVGSNYYCATTNVYNKQLRLSARSAPRPGGVATDWDVSVSIQDNIVEPQRYIAILARAAVGLAGATAADSLITLANGGRKLKSRKPDKPQPSAGSAPAIGLNRFTGNCGKDR